MSRLVRIGNVNIGAGNPVAIQSMTNVSMLDVDKTVEQMLSLQEVGCDLIRFAVTDRKCAENVRLVKEQVKMPLIADIHFDYALAIASIENGADKIRINPGNLQKSKLKEVIACAKDYQVPVRIGVNGGSVSKEMLEKCRGDKLSTLTESLKEYVLFIENLGFDKLVLSAKSTSVQNTLSLARQMHQNFDYPLHIGVTEAGLLEQGTVKNAICIGALLLEGIGDTIRVSLTDSPLKEVEVAKRILSALDLRQDVSFVSCPKCGRCFDDLETYAKTVYDYCVKHKVKHKIAVMGCEVNGPGECADADLGMACGKGKVAFFKTGKVFAVVEQKKALPAFLEEIGKLNVD